MDPSIQALFKLHAKDIERVALEKKLAQCPREKIRLDEKIKAEQASMDLKKANFKALELHQKQLEQELSVQESSLMKAKTQQAQIKKQDEYDLFSHQMEACVQKIDDLQSRILNDLLEIDRQRLVVSNFEAESKAKIAEIEKEIQAIDAEQSRLQELHDRDVAASSELAQAVSDVWLESYRTVQSRVKAPPYLVPFSDGRCQGCYLKVSSDVAQQVRSNTLVGCDQCGRLLYP
jgi:predicted  nucleic acid-binding Zn-ribbon protein